MKPWLGVWGVLAVQFLCACRVEEGEGAPGRAASEPAGAAPGAVGVPSTELVARGRYLVSHVAACSECHSPRRADKSFDEERWLSGVDCFIDVVPDNPELGCISTRNLTNHETGLSNRTDEEIKAMFLRGMRPDGKALHRFMPYAYFGNMLDADADAIVAYLRSVKGVDHTITPSQPPFLPPAVPAARVPKELIPLPEAAYPERAAALRGRYLAAEIGICMDCHTPRGERGPAFERAFEGGLEFGRSELRLPDTYPEIIYSANLTPHATGIREYSVADVVRALKHGQDKNQNGEALCPPMPAGPMEAFGGLSDADATDIGHYLLSLPPREHVIPVDCRVPNAGVGSLASASRGQR